MHAVTPKKQQDNILTVTVDTLKLVKGHPQKRGAGKHTDKRHRRSDRQSRSKQAIGEYQ